MNGITRTREEAMNAMDTDCPWCAAEATVETQGGVATFVCTDCSVRVELAADPAARVIARAA